MSTCSWCLQRDTTRWLHKAALMSAQANGRCCASLQLELPVIDSVAGFTLTLELVHDALGTGLGHNLRLGLESNFSSQFVADCVGLPLR